jgi:RES domain-containing protein
MIVYRIGRTKYAKDLTGEGARLNGGRWNRTLVPCLYTSESRALAVLEYTVNINIDDIPRALSVTTLKIPDGPVLELKIADLPGDWAAAPAPASAKDFGTLLLQAGEFVMIRIPSAVIPEEYNYLLNPIHPASSAFEVMGITDFVYDLRIKAV